MAWKQTIDTICIAEFDGNSWRSESLHILEIYR